MSQNFYKTYEGSGRDVKVKFNFSDYVTNFTVLASCKDQVD